MKTIADPETAGLFTSCLAISWKLSSICEVKGCNNKTFAILVFDESETDGKGRLIATICKDHYEEGKRKKSVTWTFEFKNEASNG